MDKHYKINIKDFIKVPILSDDVFKAMDKNNDGEVSKVNSTFSSFQPRVQ